MTTVFIGGPVVDLHTTTLLVQRELYSNGVMITMKC
jgi:hypothetical protein